MDETGLRRLLDKDEIREVLFRWCRGIDRGDAELVNSCYHPDAVDDHGANQYTGLNAGQMYVDKHLGLFSAHQHLTFQEQIRVEGDTAACESYWMALIVPKGKAANKVTIGCGRYLDRLERRNGEWRFTHRRMLVEWRMVTDKLTDAGWLGFLDGGDPGFLTTRLEGSPNGATGSTRDRHDPSYDYVPSADRARQST